MNWFSRKHVQEIHVFVCHLWWVLQIWQEFFGIQQGGFAVFEHLRGLVLSGCRIQIPWSRCCCLFPPTKFSPFSINLHQKGPQNLQQKRKRNISGHSPSQGIRTAKAFLRHSPDINSPCEATRVTGRLYHGVPIFPSHLGCSKTLGP